jgi:hypothetical protein
MTFLNKLERLSLARLERLSRNKHSCLLRKVVTYGQKKFCNIAPDLLILAILGENFAQQLFIDDV